MQTPFQDFSQKLNLDLSMYLTHAQVQNNQFTLPKMPPERPLVCRLPPVFTEYFPPEKDRLMFPPDHENKISQLSFDALETSLIEQAEKFISETFQTGFGEEAGKRELIYDRQRDLGYGVHIVANAHTYYNKIQANHAVAQGSQTPSFITY